MSTSIKHDLKSLQDDKRFDEAIRKDRACRKAGAAEAPSSSGTDRSTPSNHYQREGAPLVRVASLKAGLKWLASQQLAKTVRFRPPRSLARLCISRRPFLRWRAWP